MIFLISYPSIEERGSDVFCRILAHPNSSKNLVKISEELIEVFVNEPADKGKANKAIIKSLSKILDISSSSIIIIKGFKSQDKLIIIKNVNKNYILEKLKNT